MAWRLLKIQWSNQNYMYHKPSQILLMTLTINYENQSDSRSFKHKVYEYALKSLGSIIFTWYGWNMNRTNVKYINGSNQLEKQWWCSG